jgi:hypothetical protein
LLAGQRLLGLGVLWPELECDQTERVGQRIQLLEGLVEGRDRTWQLGQRLLDRLVLAGDPGHRDVEAAEGVADRLNVVGIEQLVQPIDSGPGLRQ